MTTIIIVTESRSSDLQIFVAFSGVKILFECDRTDEWDNLWLIFMEMGFFLYFAQHIRKCFRVANVKPNSKCYLKTDLEMNRTLNSTRLPTV